MTNNPIHHIDIPLAANVLADLHLFMRDLSYTDESTACLSLLIRALYAYEVDRLCRTPAPAARL